MQSSYTDLEQLKKMSVRELLEYYYSEWIKEQTEILNKDGNNKVKTHEDKRASELNFENIDAEKKNEINSKYDAAVKEVKDSIQNAINKLTTVDSKNAFATKNIIENKYGISIQGQYPKAVFEKVQNFLNWYNLKSVGNNGLVATNDDHVKLYESYHPIDGKRQFQRSNKNAFWFAWLWLTISLVALIFLTFIWIPQWCATGNVTETWTSIWQVVSFVLISILPFYLGFIEYYRTWWKSIPDSGVGAEKFAEKFTHNALKNALLINTRNGRGTLISFPYSSMQAITDRQLMHDHQQHVNVYAHEGSFEMIDFPLIKVPTIELVNSWHPLYYLEDKDWIYFYAGLDDNLQLGVKQYLVTGLETVYGEQKNVIKANKEKVNGKFDGQLKAINTALITLTEIINTKWNNNTKEANQKLVSTCSHISITFQYLLRNILRVITIEHNASTRIGNEETVKQYAALQKTILEKNSLVLKKLFDLELAIDAIHQYDKEKEQKIVSLFEEFMKANNVLASTEQLSEEADHLDMISGSKDELKRLVLQSLVNENKEVEKVLSE